MIRNVITIALGSAAVALAAPAIAAPGGGGGHGGGPSATGVGARAGSQGPDECIAERRCPLEPQQRASRYGHHADA